MTTRPVLRRAFLLRLKEGSLAEYVEHHRTLREVWPRMATEIAASGIATITIFEADPQLFLFSEIYDEDAWDRLWSSEAHEEWGAVMRPLMHYGPDGKVASTPLTEVFRFEVDPTG